METPKPREYWFPAKTRGWGWGPPRTWQGWAVLAAYAGLLVLGFIAFPPPREITLFLVHTWIVTALLIGICWLKGEPPRWRWGPDRK